VPSTPVEVVCGLGAGDAFGGALTHAILRGMDMPQSVRLANAAGALVASRPTCADDMPTLDELESFMRDAGLDPGRGDDVD
jgi:5-dehydro-2-deoxygluconokinase